MLRLHQCGSGIAGHLDLHVLCRPEFQVPDPKHLYRRVVAMLLGADVGYIRRGRIAFMETDASGMAHIPIAFHGAVAIVGKGRHISGQFPLESKSRQPDGIRSDRSMEGDCDFTILRNLNFLSKPQHRCPGNAGQGTGYQDRIVFHPAVIDLHEGFIQILPLPLVHLHPAEADIPVIVRGRPAGRQLWVTRKLLFSFYPDAEECAVMFGKGMLKALSSGKNHISILGQMQPRPLLFRWGGIG